MNLELYIMIFLYGNYPVSKEKHKFWEKIDNYISSKKGDWVKAYHLYCYEWRHDVSILKSLKYYLDKNYPYPIPKALFFSHMPYWNRKHIENNKKEYYKIRKIGGLAIEEFTIEDLANKWLRDCLSGESFFKRNKNYFTKNEFDIFFRSKNIFFGSYTDLIKHYYFSKIYPVRNSRLINILAEKFKNYFMNPFILNFLLFIRNNGNNIPKEYFSEICDYLLSLVNDIDQNNFSFKGRSWRGLKRLSDEWHNRLEFSPEQVEKFKKSKWQKITNIQDLKINYNNKKWEIKQITNGLWLYEEGEYMHHCCFSYIEKCINGECAIFSLRCYDENGLSIKKSATIEISPEKHLIQASGQYNNILDDETWEIFNEWKEINIITADYDDWRNDDKYWQNLEKKESDGYYSNTDYEDNLFADYADIYDYDNNENDDDA